MYKLIHAGILISLVGSVGCGFVPSSSGPTSEVIYQQRGIELNEAKLGFEFLVPENGSVTINVQSSTDRSDVYFEVYQGEEEDITVGDLIFWSNERSDGQEIESHVLEAGTYTLFLQDLNAVDGAIFSILITQ